jgi:transglutaminase-like putative cysteine protease
VSGHGSTVIAVSHETRYAYGAPVALAQHVAHLRPLEDARQRVEAFEMSVEPAPSHHTTGRDAFGNSRVFFAVTQPHAGLVVHARSRVRVASRRPQVDLGATPPWEALRERLRYAAGRPYEPAVQFATPSPFVPRLRALAELAAPCFAPGTPAAVGAVALMRLIHRDFAYCSASTAIDTPLADVLSQRRGVCQDFAHAMIGALRIQGLAARYVSGYLLTEAPQGERVERGDRPLVGADASHAWVALWCPGVFGTDDDWLELDPTNDLLADAGHVRLAVGRDYGDVTPLRGVIRGGGEHTLEVRVHTERLGAEVANGMTS